MDFPGAVCIPVGKLLQNKRPEFEKKPVQFYEKIISCLPTYVQLHFCQFRNIFAAAAALLEGDITGSIWRSVTGVNSGLQSSLVRKVENRLQDNTRYI